jgi:hypothetical protein
MRLTYTVSPCQQPDALLITECTVTAPSLLQVPLHMQLWVGALETILAIAATCAATIEPPSTVISRLLWPAVLLYCLPTLLTWWLQYSQLPVVGGTTPRHEHVHSPDRQGKQASDGQECASSSSGEKGTCKAVYGGGAGSSLGGANAGNPQPGASRGTVGVVQAGSQQPAAEAVSTPPTQQQQQEQRTPQHPTAAPEALDIGQAKAAAAAAAVSQPGSGTPSTLYTSRITTQVMSVKVRIGKGG